MTMDELKTPCTCGSGKMAGNCCKAGETCPCGSGKTVSTCCMAGSQEHAHTDDVKEEGTM